MQVEKKHIFFIWLLLPVLTFLSFNYHSKAEYKSYKHVIWADQAGYYIYLPATFIYQFEGNALPENIVKETGNGFKITSDEKISTKYHYGVALLQSPFFILAHFFAHSSSFEADGFSAPYHWAIMLAAIFYCLAGMHLLYLFVCEYVPRKIALASVFLTLISTNLYYYTIGQGGMSHAYSFFLFSAVILLTHRALMRQNVRYFLLLALVFSLAVIVRPTAILLLIFILLYNPNNQTLKKRFDFILQSYKSFAISGVLIFLVVFPQFLYWYHLSGNFIHSGYSDEGFTHWLSPQIIPVLFSANNGWFIYTPFVLVLIFALITDKPSTYKLPVITIFLLALYLFSSWWSWHFGCAFGARSFVEYIPLLSLPLASRLHKVFTIHQKVTHKVIWTSVILICTYVNIKLVYSFDTCYFGNDWEYGNFVNQLFNF